jgi:hypothetical protein
MIFRKYNTNPVIDASPRWQGCMRFYVGQRKF